MVRKMNRQFTEEDRANKRKTFSISLNVREMEIKCIMGKF